MGWMGKTPAIAIWTRKMIIINHENVSVFWFFETGLQGFFYIEAESRGTKRGKTQKFSVYPLISKTVFSIINIKLNYGTITE